jgi:uncharacterized membrane protein (UPF0127 family)
MVLTKFSYIDGKKKEMIKVKVCKSPFSKFSGLMFKKKSENLLFVFDKEKNLAIHSFFCRPFIAIWLDEKKIVTKKENVLCWLPNIAGHGRYLIEIPVENLVKKAKKQS